MINILNEEFPHPWGIEHIVVLLIAIVLNTVGPTLIHKYVKKQKTIDIILIVSASLLIACILTARISLVYYDMIIAPDAPTREYTSWWHILPDSFCAATSFAFGISIIAKRDKSNITFHCLVYMAIIGFVITFIWPNFIGKRPFFTVRTIFGLIHHILLLWCASILLATNRFRPNANYWYIMPIGLSFYMVLGVFDIHVLGMKDAMNIIGTLLPRFAASNWIGCCFLYTLFAFVTEFSYFGHKCLKAKKTITEKTSKPIIYDQKIFTLDYFKKDKILVVCYSDNTYQAFNNVTPDIVKAIWKAKGKSKNKTVYQMLINKHKPSIIMH